MTYLIFQSEILTEDNKIKSWAPKTNPKTNSAKYWWENILKIKKGDIIYFISNTYLFAKAIALVDGKEVKHQEYYDEYHDNDSWSTDGYGIISEVLETYTNKHIRIVEEMKKENYQIEKAEQEHFPFCIHTNGFRAKQGGYCFEIKDKLIAFIEECIHNSTNSISWAKHHKHQNILDKGLSKSYGTSKIGDRKKEKGARGEKNSKKIFENKGFFVEHVADEGNEPADLIISSQNNQYKIEIKNITIETAEKSIHLSDSQLQNLYFQNTYLCLYYGLGEEIIFLLNPEKQKSFIKKIIDTFDKIRKNVNDQYDGHYYIDDISILITEKMITENFIDISNESLDKIEIYLNSKK